MKSKSTAYILWFFLGVFGAHKFYLNKTGMGIVYLFTAGIFGIGWIIDIFSLGGDVDLYNAIFFNQRGPSVTNSIYVNAPHAAPPVAAGPPVHEQLKSLFDLNQAGVLTDEEYNTQKARLLS
ncbi:NINE protein [Mucilaginibacter paludis]|uniref:TM2 domain-containing protein n=1 Tax=Mucilaginibacter paludis DSM 18603 TaxID=714943 RepID=H1Y9J4_9SPHI|nr:NINE protein [Mucilaginibacter paludis]EHQ29999.1 hypothetical protein Mucpa_5939 [Mucilaginibacter paludis DSM 18603]